MSDSTPTPTPSTQGIVTTVPTGTSTQGTVTSTISSVETTVVNDVTAGATAVENAAADVLGMPLWGKLLVGAGALLVSVLLALHFVTHLF